MSRKRHREQAAEDAAAQHDHNDGKLFHHVKIIAAAAKKAKAMELQRTVKRLKNGSIDAERNALETELTTIKAMEHRTIARDVFYNKLIKARLAAKEDGNEVKDANAGNERTRVLVRTLLDAFQVPDPVSKQGEASMEGDREVQRAHARVLSNKVLAQAAAAGVDAVRRAVTGTGADGRDAGPTSLAAADKQESHADADSARTVKARLAKRPRKTTEKPVPQASGDEASEADKNSREASKVHVDTDEIHNDMVDEGESGSETGDSHLPLLSTGYVSGRGLRLGRDAEADDEDDWSDGDADLDSVDEYAEEGGKKSRKNRMGQRARRALSEKKYGRNANHLRFGKSDEGWGQRAPASTHNGRSQSSAKPAEVASKSAAATRRSLRFWQELVFHWTRPGTRCPHSTSARQTGLGGTPELARKAAAKGKGARSASCTGCSGYQEDCL